MIRKIVKKIIYGNKCDSNTYIKYLKSLGMKIGDHTKIYFPRNIIIDEQKPWLIEIGSNVQITDGVRILTHGYDWAVLKVKYGVVLGSSGKVKIGNNVFIGVNSTILKGVTIGDNVIIGANSLVNKDCIESGVYAGNPIKFIMTLEEYKNKRELKQLEEAYELSVEYFKTYNIWPKKEVLREFFYLFEDANKVKINDIFDEVMNLEGNIVFSYEVLKKIKRKFKNYDEFLNYVQRRYKNDKESN